jgi:uncharacterized RDD family membrane protein YckC
MEAINLHNQQTAGFLRRLMSGLYDWLLVLGVMMVLSVPVVAIIDDAVDPGNIFYRLALVLVAATFFVHFWSHGGQTLGMKAWRLKLINQNGVAPDTATAAKRFIYACMAMAPAGLGFLWVLVDSDKLSWHDRLSQTRIVVLPKRTGSAASKRA